MRTTQSGKASTSLNKESKTTSTSNSNERNGDTPNVVNNNLNVPITKKPSARRYLVKPSNTEDLMITNRYQSSSTNASFGKTPTRVSRLASRPHASRLQPPATRNITSGSNNDTSMITNRYQPSSTSASFGKTPTRVSRLASRSHASRFQSPITRNITPDSSYDTTQKMVSRSGTSSLSKSTSSRFQSSLYSQSRTETKIKGLDDSSSEEDENTAPSNTLSINLIPAQESNFVPGLDEDSDDSENNQGKIKGLDDSDDREEKSSSPNHTDPNFIKGLDDPSDSENTGYVKGLDDSTSSENSESDNFIEGLDDPSDTDDGPKYIPDLDDSYESMPDSAMIDTSLSSVDTDEEDEDIYETTGSTPKPRENTFSRLALSPIIKKEIEKERFKEQKEKAERELKKIKNQKATNHMTRKSIYPSPTLATDQATNAISPSNLNFKDQSKVIATINSEIPVLDQTQNANPQAQTSIALTQDQVLVQHPEDLTEDLNSEITIKPNLTITIPSLSPRTEDIKRKSALFSNENNSELTTESTDDDPQATEEDLQKLGEASLLFSSKATSVASDKNPEGVIEDLAAQTSTEPSVTTITMPNLSPRTDAIKRQSALFSSREVSNEETDPDFENEKDLDELAEGSILFSARHTSQAKPLEGQNQAPISPKIQNGSTSLSDSDSLLNPSNHDDLHQDQESTDDENDNTVTRSKRPLIADRTKLQRKTKTPAPVNIEKEGILRLLETKITSLRDERSVLFYLAFNLDKTDSKIETLDAYITLLKANQKWTMQEVNQEVYKWSKDKECTQSRLGFPFFSLSKSNTEKLLTEISVTAYQEELEAIFMTEQRKIEKQKASCFRKPFYNQEKSDQKYHRITDILSDYVNHKKNNTLETLENLGNYLESIQTQQDLIQHRSIGLFGCHLTKSDTQKKLEDLTKRVNAARDKLAYASTMGPSP